MASKNLPCKKTSREVTEFFLKILETYDEPIYYDRLRGYISSSTQEIKAYVKKYCRGEELLTFFKRRRVVFTVTRDNCIEIAQRKKKKREKIMSDDDEEQGAARSSADPKQTKGQKAKLSLPKKPKKVDVSADSFNSCKLNIQMSCSSLSPASRNVSLKNENPRSVPNTRSSSVERQQPIVDEAELEEEAVEHFKDCFCNNSHSYLQLYYEQLPRRVKSYLKLKYTNDKIHRFLLDHCHIFAVDDDGHVSITNTLKEDESLSTSIGDLEMDESFSISISDNEAQKSEEDNNEYSENNTVSGERVDIVSTDESLQDHQIDVDGTTVVDLDALDSFLEEVDKHDIKKHFFKVHKGTFLAEVDTKATESYSEKHSSDKKNDFKQNLNKRQIANSREPKNADVIIANSKEPKNFDVVIANSKESEDADSKEPTNADAVIADSKEPKNADVVIADSKEPKNAGVVIADSKKPKNTDVITGSEECSQDQQLSNSHDVFLRHKDTLVKERKHLDSQNLVNVCDSVIRNGSNDSSTIKDTEIGRNVDNEMKSSFQNSEYSDEHAKECSKDPRQKEHSLSFDHHKESSTTTLQTFSTIDDSTTEQDLGLPKQLYALEYFIKIMEDRRNTSILIEKIHSHLSQAKPYVLNYIKRNFNGKNFKKFFTTYPKIFIVKKKTLTLSKKYASEFGEMLEHAKVNATIQNADNSVANNLVTPVNLLNWGTKVEERITDEVVVNPKKSQKPPLPKTVPPLNFQYLSMALSGINTSISLSPSSPPILNTEANPEREKVQQALIHNGTHGQGTHPRKEGILLPESTSSVEVNPCKLNNPPDNIKASDLTSEKNGEFVAHCGETHQDLTGTENIQLHTFDSDFHDDVQINLYCTNTLEQKNSTVDYEHCADSETSQSARSYVFTTEQKTATEHTIDTLPNNSLLLNGSLEIDDTSYEHSMMKRKTNKTYPFSQNESSTTSEICTNNHVDINDSIVELSDSTEDFQDVENSDSKDNADIWQGTASHINRSARDDQKGLIGFRESVIPAPNGNGTNIIVTIYDRDYEILEQDKILQDFPTYFSRFICTYDKEKSEEDNAEVEIFSGMLENDYETVNEIEDRSFSLDVENQCSIKEENARNDTGEDVVSKNNTNIENNIEVDGQVSVSTVNSGKTITCGTKFLNVSPSELDSRPLSRETDKSSSTKETNALDASELSLYKAGTNNVLKDMEEDVSISENQTLVDHSIILENLIKTDGDLSVLRSIIPKDDTEILRREIEEANGIVSMGLVAETNAPVSEYVTNEADAINSKFDEELDTTISENKSKKNPVLKNLSKDTNILSTEKKYPENDATVLKTSIDEDGVVVSKNLIKEDNATMLKNGITTDDITDSKDLVEKDDATMLKNRTKKEYTTTSKDLVVKDAMVLKREIGENSVIMSETQIDKDCLIALRDQIENFDPIPKCLIKKGDITTSQTKMKENDSTSPKDPIEEDETNHSAEPPAVLNQNIDVLSSDTEYFSISPASCSRSPTSDNKNEKDGNLSTFDSNKIFDYVKNCDEIIRCYDADVKSLVNGIPNNDSKEKLSEDTIISNGLPENNTEDGIGLVHSGNEGKNSRRISKRKNRVSQRCSRIHSNKPKSQSLDDEICDLEESGFGSALSTGSRERTDSVSDTVINLSTDEQLLTSSDDKTDSSSSNQEAERRPVHSQKKDDLACPSTHAFLPSQRMENLYGYVILLTKDVCVAKSIESGLPIFCHSDFFKCHKHNTGLDACFCALAIGDMVCCSVVSPSPGTHIMTCCQFSKAHDDNENEPSFHKLQETENAASHTDSVPCCYATMPSVTEFRNTSSQTISTGEIYLTKCHSYDA